MATFLFWNIKGKQIVDRIVTLAHTYSIDVLMLAESSIAIDIMGIALNAGQKELYFPDPGFSNKIQIFTRYLHSFVRPVRDSGGIAIRYIKPPIGQSVLLVAVHLPSKLYQTEADQMFECGRLAKIITDEEWKAGHSRTLLIGDLNMNPFEYGVVSADGLHGLSDHRIVQRGFRRVSGEMRTFFYNPMWNHFGDMSLTPPGTYFFDTGRQVNFYWNMFDQVLVRPELLYSFRHENLQIITEIDGISLINENGRPNVAVGSDHLPIYIKLDL
ncbi:MAG: hypothetical protein ACLPYB_16165 [Desulfobaccales bacterium]